MKVTQCAFNSAVALRRVFINNALATQRSGQLVLPRVLLPSLAEPQPRRAFTIQSPLFSKEQPGRLIRDLHIKSPFVHVRDPETGQLSGPTSPQDILRTLNTKEFSLVVVADPETQNFGPNGPKYPICNIVDRKAERENRHQAVLAERHKKEVDKEIEINWGIAEHDLQLKMRRLRQFLDKGYKVQLTLMRKMKRGKKLATIDECKVLLNTVEEAINQLPGVKDAKPRDGQVGRIWRATLQGTKGSLTAAAKANAVGEEEEAEETVRGDRS